MTKPMLVTLPLVLLLLDYWPLQRWHGLHCPGGWRAFLRLIVEKVPLLILSLASSVITLKAQAGAGAGSAAGLPLAFRFANALWSLVRYLQLALLPAKLAVLYPLLKIHTWRVALAVTVLFGVTACVIYCRDHKYLPVGWFWFVGALVPVLGIVQVGRQAMADRYAYVPMIGIFILLSWGTAEIASKARLSQRWLLAPFAALLVLCVVTRRQIAYWHDYTTLFAHTVAVTEHNYTAQVNLGAALSQQGHPEEALQHYYAALADNPNYGLAIFDVAVYYEKKGDFPTAIAKYKSAIPLLDPNLAASAYTNIGIMDSNMGHDPEAEENFLHALGLDSWNFNANLGLGKILYQRGSFEQSLPYLFTAAAIHSTGENQLLLGDALRAAGHMQQARSAYAHALVLDPGLKRAQAALAALDSEERHTKSD